jgi:enamine deaminase RidA (YjgF/YER057c/UK114 family)
LKRQTLQAGSEPSPLAPYLSDAVKAGPYVFPSGVMVTTEPSTNPYNSPIRQQTELVLKRLELALKAGGSSLDSVVRMKTYHTNLDDLPIHVEVLRRHLGQTRLGPDAIGCGLVQAAAVVEVDVIGLAAGSGVKRELIETDSIPRSGERYAQGVKAGPFVFVAGVTATDFKTGVAMGAQVPEGMPLVGSPIKRQTAWALDAIARVLEAAGSSLDQVVRAQVVLRDLTDFFAFDEVWRSYFGDTPPARTVLNAELVNPGCVVEVDVVAIAPGSGLKKEIVTTVNAPVPTVAEPQAVKAGEFLFVSGLLPTDWETGLSPEVRIDPSFPRDGSAIKKQAGYILRNLKAILEAGGSSLENVVRVGAYHTHIARDLLGAMEVRRQHFPEHPPASLTIELPRLLVPGSLFMFDAIAVTND